MTFKNIQHKLETFTVEQELNFAIVETLINNLNSIKPSHTINNTVKFENNEFKSVNLGYKHSFLIKDIQKAILGDLEQHKKFIIKEVEKDLKYFNSTNDYINAKTSLENLIKYYSVNYPCYNNTDDFKLFIVDIYDKVKAIINLQ